MSDSEQDEEIQNLNRRQLFSRGGVAFGAIAGAATGLLVPSGKGTENLHEIKAQAIADVEAQADAAKKGGQELSTREIIEAYDRAYEKRFAENQALLVEGTGRRVSIGAALGAAAVGLVGGAVRTESDRTLKDYLEARDVNATGKARS